MTYSEKSDIMLFVQDIEEIVKTALWTGSVANERPVSLMLDAPPEHGKTEIMLKYTELNNPHIMLFSDITITSLRNILNSIKNGTTSFIVCPDFIKVTSRKDSSVQNTVTLLNSLIEEGVIKIDIYGFNFQSDKPVRCGMLSGITPDIFKSRKVRGYWKKIGLNTRMLFVSWSYTTEQIRIIKQFIKKEHYHNDKPVKLRFPKKPVPIKLPEHLAEQLDPISKDLAKQFKTLGFRFQKQLQVMTKARALMKKKKIVTQDEIDEIMYFANWMNIKENKLGDINDN